MIAAQIGFTLYGKGPKHVLMLHDWFCDHSNWDAMLPYLAPESFTYAFADLRGYGASKEIDGDCTLEESASDAIALADRLNWSRFSLIGHSMSGLIVQRMAQLVPDRIERVVAITPVPPTGMGLDSNSVAFMRSIALGGDEERYATVSSMWGTRLSDTWIRYKLRRWRETAVPVAVAKYVELWGTMQISQESRGFKTPILVVAAAQDAPPFREAALEASMMPFYPNGRLISLGESGHYPMQEQPPLLATAIERYLGA